MTHDVLSRFLVCQRTEARWHAQARVTCALTTFTSVCIFQRLVAVLLVICYACNLLSCGNF